MRNFFKVILFIFILIIFKNIFIIYKIHDQKLISNNYDYVKQDLKDYNNIKMQQGIINYNDSLNFGIYKYHPFSHPNDFDINLLNLSNNMNILNCGCGLIETEIRILQKYPNIKIHSLTNDKNSKKKILNKIKTNNMSNNIKLHFTDYKNIKTRFDEIKFDRILFIESISYVKNISEIFKNCYNSLKENGVIYLRLITCPITKNEYISKNLKDIENKLQLNLLFHENVINFLQKANFKKITYSSS